MQHDTFLFFEKPSSVFLASLASLSDEDGGVSVFRFTRTEDSFPTLGGGHIIFLHRFDIHYRLLTWIVREMW